MSINRASKDTGGLSGKTENVGASERWMRINHIMTALREHLDGVIRKKKLSKHVELGKKRMLADEHDVRIMMACLDEWVPGLWEDDQALENIATDALAPTEMVEGMKNMKCNGTQEMDNFISRFAQREGNEGTKSYYDSIKRKQIINFETKKQQKVTTISDDENKSFGDIFSRFDQKKLNLRMIMDWPVTSKPYAIASEDGKVRSNPKSLFRNYLQTLSSEQPTKNPPLSIHTSIVDAMRVVRMVPIRDLHPPTFGSWAEKVFAYIQSLPGNSTHIVFDNYAPSPDPSKVISKGRIKKGLERKISNLTQVLPKLNEWQNFLTNDKNKYQICCLLANYFTSDNLVTSKTIYVTIENKCFIKDAAGVRREIEELNSTHREADHRLPFHAKFASCSGGSVCVVADDTDVYILLLHVALACTSTLYFRQATKSTKAGITYHNVTSLANKLGEEVCDILPCFHALTGSDFTKTFYRRSNTQSFKKMLSGPSNVRLLVSLKNEMANIVEVIDFVLHVIYNRPIREKNSRYAMLFTGKGTNKKVSPTKSLPPDQKSLEMKIMQANLVSHGWINCANAQYVTLDPCAYGWKIENEELVPLWFQGDALPCENEIEETNIEIEVVESDNSRDDASDVTDSDESDVGVISECENLTDSDDED